MIKWPTPEEIKDYRDGTGEGLQQSRLILRRKAMLAALGMIPSASGRSEVFRDILTAIVEDHYPKERLNGPFSAPTLPPWTEAEVIG